jgi:hypothetical protein
MKTKQSSTQFPNFDLRQNDCQDILTEELIDQSQITLVGAASRSEAHR